MTEYYGVELPDNRYVWANGQTLDRMAYASAFNALTRTTTATVGGNAIVLPVTEDLTGKALIGSVVEGPGIQTGTTVVSMTATSVTVSKPTSGASAATTIRFFPYGNGDGATTFTVPDRREVVAVGSSVMGGTGSPGRITAASMASGANLGQVVGEERHTLTIAELAAHDHAVNDNGHAHGVTDPKHAHGYAQATNPNGVPGGTPYTSAYTSNAAAVTDAAATGITVNTSKTGVTVQSTGGGGSHNNLQPTLVCNYILRAA